MTHVPGTPWRILFAITSSDIGGAESLLRELVLRLDRREFDPVVVSLQPCGRTGSEIAAGGTRVLTLQMSERWRFWELIAGALRLARLVDDLDIDVMHSSLYRANVLSRIAARLSRRRPVVVSGQHSIRPLGGRCATLAERLTWRLSDRFTVPSQAVHDRLIKTERLPRNRVVLIENGVDNQRYDCTATEVGRSHIGLDSDAMVVGAVGRLSPEKGVHHLLKTLVILRRNGLLLDLIVVGDGPERLRLELDTRDLGLDGHVKFLGVRRDLPSIYAAMDIFALPSLQEASPMALLEAMAAGRPIVATSVGGVPEILEHGRSGLLVPPRSPAALADALARLAGDPALRNRLGDAARRRVATRFDISHTVERHAQLYRELLTQRRSAQ